MADTQIYRRAEADGKTRRGYWRRIRVGRYGYTAEVGCVLCGHVISLEMNGIMGDGTVACTVECPLEDGGCGWTGHARLARWAEPS
jgi:hypothetical protein